MAQQTGVRSTTSRPTRRSSSKSSGTGTSTVSPTRSVEAGYVHQRVAAIGLTLLQQRTGLSVGEIPEAEPIAGTASGDPDRLFKLASHMVARLADRAPIFRKLSRHAEGVSKRSGIVSDIVAALTELYRLNPDVVNRLGSDLMDTYQSKRAARAAGTNPTDGGTI